jgi:hypothetical protein
MKSALMKFLDVKSSNFPYEIPVNSEINFSFYESNPGNGKLFTAGGRTDSNAGGWVVSIYSENIRHCIEEKSSKIFTHLQRYSDWWLYLVDCIGFWLDTDEISEVVKLVGNTGSFNKVCLLSYDGQNVLATMTKQKA